MCHAGMATPDAPTARSPQPAPIYRKASRGIPGGLLFPWRRSASTAINSGRLPIAMTEVAGPSSVPCACPSRFPSPTLQTRMSPTRSWEPYNCRKSTKCDLLHKRPGGLGLNLQNGPENLPIIVRSAARHRHRLRLGCCRRRGCPDRPDLSHPDLIQPETAARNIRPPIG
jgi:hypothetical protein